MKTFKTLISLLVFITLIASCRKDSISSEVAMIPPIPQNNIETTINGFISDLDGNPIADATVSVSNSATQTNEFGFFEVTSLVNEKMAVIEVEKMGYFDQYETIVPTKGDKNRTRIKLIERNNTGSFSSASGGTVSINTESTVVFQANSFIDEAGNTYNGEVKVYSFFIDPTHEDIDQIMPGNLMAINVEEELNVLQSFGMVNVELEGENGQKLNINQAATLTVDVPQSIVNDAPNEIPLWFFDENTGLWVEEGYAVLDNGKYVGAVNHFTFWNCDVPFDLTLINGQIFDETGVSIMRVRITSLATGASFTSWTDSGGAFAGGVPKNEGLLLEVLGFCGEEVLFSENIGPFTEDEVDLGTYSILNNTNFAFITGTLVDCDMIPLDNGQVYIKLPNQSFNQQALTDASGNFSALVPTCDMEAIEIRGVNLTDGLVSQTITVLPSSTIELGLVEVCADVSGVQGQVIINVNGEQKIIDNCIVTTNSNPGSTGYVFLYYDVLPISGDSIQYSLSMVDNNDDLTNPNWTGHFFGWGPPASAADEIHTLYIPSYQSGFGTITVDQIATNSGELMQLSFENATVSVRIKDPNGPNTWDNYSGSSMTISAVLQ